MNKNKGFTLIELLVVIAIIGILSSVVLASLNTARNKGADAAIKAALSGTRAQAELFYDASQSYEGVCALTGTNTIGAMVNSAERNYGNTTPTTYADTTASLYNTAQCHDVSSAWAAIVPLKASASGSIVAWCVDSAGSSKQVTTALVAGGVAPIGYICP